jgi:glycosyltransferase involved in cell wall biosynthesis
MKLKLFLEHRFKRTPDGQVWSPLFNYEMWQRYLRVFSEVTLGARVEDVPEVAADVAAATGEGIKLAGLPHYHGPKQYWQTRRAFRAAISSLIAPGQAYIVRVPGNVATQAVAVLQEAEVPYAVEAIGDPWDTFSPGCSDHPLRWIFRRTFTRAMRRQCAHAAVSLYVTERALQRRYPPNAGAPTFHASNVFLAPPSAPSTAGNSDVARRNSAFVDSPRRPEEFAIRPLRSVCVGSFNLLYKAQDVLVKAFARAVKQGLDGHLSFVGDGIYQPDIEALARKHGCLQDRVEFLGQLRGGAAVREVLDRSHVFVLPSRQEGLPRAALEAMGRALPCIGSNVGGFPEILEPDAIVRPNDIRGLAECLSRLASNPTRLAEMSARNLRRATDFQADKLAVRQSAYYAAVRDHFTAFWQRPLASARWTAPCDRSRDSSAQSSEPAPNARRAA